MFISLKLMLVICIGYRIKLAAELTKGLTLLKFGISCDKFIFILSYIGD